MEYRIFGTERMSEVLEIFGEAGWRAYLGDDDKLKRALENSPYLLGAFEGEALVGFIRCVGDGEHIVYVQDLIVRKADRRKGIGRELMRRAMEKYARVRMFTLITDAGDETANAFYRSLGMKAYESGGMAGYYR